MKLGITVITPEGDLALHMAYYQGYITKYSLERELIWSSNPATQNASNRKTYNSYDRNGGTTICTISAIQSCSNPNIPDPTHPAGPNCQGPFGVMEQETCVTYSGGGGGTSNNGGSSSSNDDDCDGSGGTSGTLIQGTQPISGVNGGCAPNETIGVLPDGDVIIECNVSPAVQTNVVNCIIENSFSQPDIQNFLLNPANSCTLVDIALYLNENNCSEEARNNIIEDIETFMFASIYEFSVNNLTNDCAKLIVRDDIIGTGNPVNAGLINIIRNTFNFDENVTLSFTNSYISSDANASTDFDTSENIESGIYDIQITLDNNYLDNNPTKLSIALTVIHEMVHAKFMYAYLNGTLLTEYPELTDLNDKFEIFLEDRSIENGIALEESMHIAMVDLISKMSYSLYKYAQHTGMNNITEEYCKEITKGSFYNTPSAMDLINTGESTPEELKDKFIDEQNNTTDAQGDDC
jgi:hypothetical protein